MGVGIAIVVSMQPVNISYIKVGEHIHSICKLRENTIDSNLETSIGPANVLPDL